jgi:hypothetical protein
MFGMTKGTTGNQSTGREASEIYRRHQTPDRNTDYSTTKKIYRNREISAYIYRADR